MSSLTEFFLDICSCVNILYAVLLLLFKVQPQTLQYLITVSLFVYKHRQVNYTAVQPANGIVSYQHAQTRPYITAELWHQTVIQ